MSRPRMRLAGADCAAAVVVVGAPGCSVALRNLQRMRSAWVDRPGVVGLPHDHKSAVVLAHVQLTNSSIHRPRAGTTPSTGGLHDTLDRHQAVLQDQLNRGSYHLSADISGLGVVKADGSSVEYIVAVSEYHLGRQGTKSGPYLVTLDVTTARDGWSWKLSESTPLR